EFRRQMGPRIDPITLAGLQPTAPAGGIANIEVNRTRSGATLQNASYLFDGLRVVDPQVQRQFEPFRELLLRLRHAENPAQHKAGFFPGPLNNSLDDADAIILKFILETDEVIGPHHTLHTAREVFQLAADVPAVSIAGFLGVLETDLR